MSFTLIQVGRRVYLLMADPGGSGHWEGEKANPHNYFGFVYCITHLPSGKKYLGRKQYYNSKKQYGCSKRSTDRQSKAWKPSCWKDSNWRIYTGSSKTLNDLIKEEGKENFKFEILCQCRSKSLLHYWELKLLWHFDVMAEKFEDGTYKYFNNSIGSIKFKV